MNKLKFSELNLSAEILKGVTDMGFEEATHIQSEAIPIMIKGCDLIGQAQTGTGKTAAFGIPLLEMVDPKDKKTQALVMCPTRELAVQVAEEIKNIGKHKRGINILAVYGGQPIDRQIRALRSGVQIIIGTPGRLLDHIERKTVQLSTTKIVVLDEADEMLNMGFIDDIELILKQAPVERQTVLFSATMPRPILNITKRYQKDPQMIKITHEMLTAPLIDQSYFEIRRGAKLEALCRLIDANDFKLSLVFCNTKSMVDELENQMNSRGYQAESLHGGKSQNQRDAVMAKVRNGKTDLLIATDVAARGIDIDDIEAVFNYDVPSDEEYYVHRIGRTGRAGREGKAFTFVSGDEMYKMRDIMRYAKAKIKAGVIPTRSNMEELHTGKFIEEVKEVVKKGGLEPQVKLVEKLLAEELTSLDIIAALIKLYMPQLGDKKAEESLQVFRDRPLEETTGSGRSDRYGSRNDRGRNSRNDRGDRGDRNGDKPAYEKFSRSKGTDKNMDKLFVGAGKTHGVMVKDILGAITGETGIRGEQIGRIDMFPKHTFVQIESTHSEYVVTRLNGKKIKGVKVFVEKSKD
jgi:ATP-dependent RNA helicase DeaD